MKHHLLKHKPNRKKLILFWLLIIAVSLLAYFFAPQIFYPAIQTPYVDTPLIKTPDGEKIVNPEDTTKK